MIVLVIPEDFRNDQYLLKPIMVELFASLGKPRAKVIVCADPLLRGVSEALKSERVEEVIERYPMADMFLLCVDRDGQLGRRSRLDQLERQFGDRVILFAANAWEELETWALAGLTLLPGWTWANVRAAVSVKEDYFQPLAQSRGVSDGPGGGRKALGMEAASRLPAILRKCPEDFGDLAGKVAARLQTA